MHPEIFPADGRPNVIINPTGMAVFDDGHTVGEALDVYRQVLADPNSAASLSNTPNPDTPEGIAFVQAWERAVRFKNSPEGQTWDSNSVWTTDALGKPVPQIEQSRPDAEFAAMAAQRQTGASFSLNLLFPERSASLNHTPAPDNARRHASGLDPSRLFKTHIILDNHAISRNTKVSKLPSQGTPAPPQPKSS
ncbi:hypothetical protein [Zoogloea sp.]|uniref:hypothetical protein n=1 Tax=Zoogloea sp. TaxID=49181 RepID=UPI001AC1B8D4|nr:hypothetical protein [Zoogloea sp.]MBN8284297.1 hypothetical protein [Zoogloea sp.]